jgi:hypothetical protein
MLTVRSVATLLLACTALTASSAGRPPTLVTYTLEEKTSAVTPNGERISGLAAKVSVAGERARLELSGATLPGLRGSLVLLDGRGVVLVDPGKKDGARFDGGGLEALLRPERGEEGGGAGFRLRDKHISVTRDGAGAPFQGAATARWRVLVNSYLNVTTPGRVATLHDVTKGVIETVEAPEAASALDDLGRLFRIPAEARTALDQELENVGGFPVRVELESEREMSAEAIGATAAHDALDRPMKTTLRSERKVTDLVKRPLAKRDEALFAVPEDVSLRDPSRLRKGEAPLGR